ncbi:competence protein ComEC family protein [Patescibacteria group bacterium]|nr:competence protein ComEC family protein [Patescibacteria group bacterium]
MRSKSKIFLICCLAFIFGVAIASFSPIKIIQNDLWWFAGMVGCAVLLILFWLNAKARLTALIGLFLFLAIWRYSIGLPIDTPDKIWHYNGQTVIVSGAVSDEPDIRQNNVKLEVKSNKLKIFQEPQSSIAGWNYVFGKILITANLYPAYNYGDELEIICELQAPERFNNFSYDRYLARYDIYSVCYYPEIKFAGEGVVHYTSVGWFYRNIFSLKNKFRQIINYGLSEPEAGLAGAIVLGDKRSITAGLRQQFSQSGLSHIMAISGLHISILAMLVMSLLLGAGLPRKKAFWLAVLFLFVYIVLIGIPASALRAGLMGFLALYAMNIGRLNKLTNSLVFAAVVLLLFNPKLLRDDISFQLSFLAVAGIAYIYPIINNALERVKAPKLKGIGSVFGITAAAQVFTLPIIAYNFFVISVVAPLANLLVLWTLPLLISLVLIALILSLILPQLAVLFFLPAGLLLKYIIFIVERSTKLPYAYVQIDYLWPGWLFAYYAIAIWLLWKYKRKFKNEESIG